MNISKAVSVLYLLVSCQNHSEDFLMSKYTDVIANTSSDQKVCGIFSERKITLAHGDYPSFINIRDYGPMSFDYEGKICVVGQIVYIGCYRGKRLCTDWASDYAINIERVIFREG